jgi:hypothetical protein
VEELTLQSSAPLTRIMNKIAELSAKTEKARKELEKNSEPGPAGSNSSSSPVNGVVPSPLQAVA